MLAMMSVEEVALYESLLGQARTLLEYGSGGSTVLAAKHPDLRITAIDSDQAWFTLLREQPEIRDAEATGRLQLRHVDIGPTGKVGRPVDTSAKHLWHNYSMLPWSIKGFSPDLIFIDGRFRVACALETLRHAPVGASIAIHDFQRPTYRPVLLFFKLVGRARNLAVLQRRKFVLWPLLNLLLLFYRTYPS